MSSAHDCNILQWDAMSVTSMTSVTTPSTNITNKTPQVWSRLGQTLVQKKTTPPEFKISVASSPISSFSMTFSLCGCFIPKVEADQLINIWNECHPPTNCGLGDHPIYHPGIDHLWYLWVQIPGLGFIMVYPKKICMPKSFWKLGFADLCYV